MNVVPTTSDGEWEEDELLSLVMDQCFHRCEAINADIAKGINTMWYDTSLNYCGNMCQKVVGDDSLVSMYDELGGLEQFEKFIAAKVEEVVEANRYKGYIRSDSDV